ncbi:hypothetical protein C0993_010052 [Termitomyces sp. T159_Od127]|nr:hypothetical protein C0993_010052 [Termitomyces sp. T159_Od127]
MSGEVLNNDYVLHPDYKTPTQIQTGKKFFMHNPAHDIESCLWVLIHICLIHDGPGANAYQGKPCRADTQSPHTSIGETNSNEDDSWRQIVFEYFDGPIEALSHVKGELYKQSNGRTIKQITEHFHEYFQSLASLVEKWWDLIIFTHSFHGREYLNIHSLSILLIEDTIKSLKSSPPSEDYLSRKDKEIQCRAAEKERLLQTFCQALQEHKAVSFGSTRTAASSGFETSSNPTKKFKAKVWS